MEYKIDCKNKRLGRIASEVAIVLQGKKNPSYSPNKVGDDTVLIENVDDLELSGKKEEQKIYYSHNTQIGHLKKKTIKNVITKLGKKYVLTKAVTKMLPKNRLQAKRIKKMTFK